MGQHSQPIILKVPETIGSPRDHFHLVVEALRDAVTFAESPHGNNGFQLDGGASGDVAGFSVAAAGDVNGDGFV